MKKHILSIFYIFLFANANAQFFDHHIRSPLTKVRANICNYYITYTYKYVLDTIQKRSYYDKQVLEIGDSIIKYSSLYADKIDSMWQNYLNQKHRPNKDGTDGINPQKMIGLKPNDRAIYEDYYINYPVKNILTVSTGIWGKEYVYEEPVPKFEWKIQSDTLTVLGYKCIKAIATFRGRTYEAWFTPLIPIRQGPWKFNGLLGLILKVTDTKGYFEWTAIGVEKPQNRNLCIINFDIIPKSLVRTTRKDLVKLLHKRWKDPFGLAITNFPANYRGAYSLGDPLGTECTVSRDNSISTKNVQFSYIPIPELE
jgi:GLPGLI family protein